MDSMPRLVVLRLVNGVVLDHPFGGEVRFPLWAATLDADTTDPFGWRREVWRKNKLQSPVLTPEFATASSILRVILQRDFPVV